MNDYSMFYKCRAVVYRLSCIINNLTNLHVDFVWCTCLSQTFLLGDFLKAPLEVTVIWKANCLARSGIILLENILLYSPYFYLPEQSTLGRPPFVLHRMSFRLTVGLTQGIFFQVLLTPILLTGIELTFVSGQKYVIPRITTGYNQYNWWWAISDSQKSRRVANKSITYFYE